MSNLVNRIRQNLARRQAARRGRVTFDEATNQVCDNHSRAAALRELKRTAGIYGAF